MRILIDNSNLFAGGGVQVATSFLNDLKDLQSSDIYYIVQSVNSARQIYKEEFSDRFVFFDLTSEQQPVIKRVQELKRIERLVKPDIIFTVFGPSYYKSRSPKVVGFAIPHIIYSNSPFFSKISFLERYKINVTSYLKNIFFKNNSDALIFESEDAMGIYLSKIKKPIKSYVVSNTLNSIFNNADLWKNITIEKACFNILYLTANYPHKNLNIIPDIIDYLILNDRLDNFKFNLSVNKEELMFDDRYDKYINYLGNVDIMNVPSLYKEMDLLLMPSLLEVFSTSYLEAMYMQIPIISSDMSFARDICADSALFADPLDAADYADKILLLYTNKELYNNLVKKGAENLKRFGTSMDRTKKYLEILKKHANADN